MFTGAHEVEPIHQYPDSQINQQDKFVVLVPLLHRARWPRCQRRGPGQRPFRSLRKIDASTCGKDGDPYSNHATLGQGDARAYIRAPGERRPSDARATPGRTSDPLKNTKRCACHANRAGRAATQRRQGDATGEHQALRLPCKLHRAQQRQGDTRAYIPPLGEHQALRLPGKSLRCHALAERRRVSELNE